MIFFFFGCILLNVPELAEVNSPGSSLFFLCCLTHACVCSSQMSEFFQFKPLTEETLLSGTALVSSGCLKESY